MTTLVQTSSSVAVNSHLSDLSFRAILRRLKRPGRQTETGHGPRARANVLCATCSRADVLTCSRACPVLHYVAARRTSHVARQHVARQHVARDAAVSSHQPDGGKDTTLAGRGSLRSQRTVLHRTARSDDCSLLTCALPFLFQSPHFLLEHAVRARRSRGTCRSSRTPARAPRRRPARLTQMRCGRRPPYPPPRVPGTRVSQGRGDQLGGLTNGDDDRRAGRPAAGGGHRSLRP